MTRTGWLGRRRVLLALAGCLVIGVAAVGIARLTPHYALYRAQLAQQARDADAAIAWLHQAERIDPRRSETHFRLARAYRRLGDFDAVRERLARAQRLGHPIDELKREQWLTLAQAGQIAEAEPHLSELLMNPGNDGPEICEAFVHGYCVNLQFAPARRILDVWQADFPADPEPHFRRGFIDQATHNLEAAIQHYRRGLELGPHRSDARVRLGECLRSLNRYAEAEREFRRRFKDDPSDVSALSGLAESLIAQKRGEEARALYKQILRIDAEHFEASRGLARLKLQARDAQAAVRELEPLARERPYDTATLSALAQAYSAVGDQDNARRLIEKVREAEEPLSRMEDLVEQVVHQPNDPELRYQVGTILLRYGSPDDGVRWLRTALQINAEHAATHRALAEFYAQRGDHGRAGQHRRAAAQAAESADDS